MRTQSKAIQFNGTIRQKQFMPMHMRVRVREIVKSHFQGDNFEFRAICTQQFTKGINWQVEKLANWCAFAPIQRTRQTHGCS
jgi:hypothetical protein